MSRVSARPAGSGCGGAGGDAGVAAWGAGGSAGRSVRRGRPLGRHRAQLSSPGQGPLEPLDPCQQGRGRGIDLRRRRLDQDKLELDPGLGAVRGRLEGIGDEVEQADRVGLREGAGLVGQTLISIQGDSQLRRHVAENLNGQQLAGVGLEIPQDLTGVTAGLGQAGSGAQRLGGISLRDRLHGLEQLLGVGDAEHGEHVGGLDPLVARVRHELLEGAQRVAEAAGGVARDQSQGGAVDVDLLLLGHAAKHLGHVLGRGPAEVEAVAAVHDSGQHLLRLGGGQHEDRPRRRLLERLEKGVPRLLREHVRLVEDVHLVTARYRRVRDLLAQIPDVVNRVVRRGVHLDHVEGGRVLDREAGLTLPARADGRPLLAVQARREDLGHARLAGAARADEQVGVVDLALADRVLQRAHDVLLTNDVGEGAGTVAAVERGSGGHGESSLVGLPAQVTGCFARTISPPREAAGPGEKRTVHPPSRLVSEARPPFDDSGPALPLRLEVTA